jgi:hypothetical protein
MAAKDKDTRHGVTLGFQGGGGLALKLLEKDAQALMDALPKGEWHDVQDAEGPVRINLSQVIWVRDERDEPKVGFGLG